MFGRTAGYQVWTAAAVTGVLCLVSMVSGSALGQGRPQTPAGRQQPQTPPANVVVRPAEEVLAQLEGITLPELDESRVDDESYMQRYYRARTEAGIQITTLIHELYTNYPDHERLDDLMDRRWRLLYEGKRFGAIRNESAEVLGRYDSQRGIYKAAKRWNDYFEIKPMFDYTGTDPAQKLKKAREYAAKYPEDENSALFLYLSARDMEPYSDEQLALFREIVALHGDTPVGRRAKGKLRQVDSIGKPFALSFKDALTEQDIDIADYRGKVVVVHFWASWWPSVLDVEKVLIEMSKRYEANGIQVLGVSLDQSPAKQGFEQLKKFVTDHEIPWPQYYQGNAWTGTFSASWGIDAVPWSFVVDQDGNLYACNPADDLENIVRKLYGLEPLPKAADDQETQAKTGGGEGQGG